MHCPHILQTQEARLGFSPLLPLSSLPRYCCWTWESTFTVVRCWHQEAIWGLCRDHRRNICVFDFYLYVNIHCTKDIVGEDLHWGSFSHVDCRVCIEDRTQHSDQLKLALYFKDCSWKCTNYPQILFIDNDTNRKLYLEPCPISGSWWLDLIANWLQIYGWILIANILWGLFAGKRKCRKERYDIRSSTSYRPPDLVAAHCSSGEGHAIISAAAFCNLFINRRKLTEGLIFHKR